VNWASWGKASAEKSTVVASLRGLAAGVHGQPSEEPELEMTWVVDAVLVQALVRAGVALVLVVRTAR